MLYQLTLAGNIAVQTNKFSALLKPPSTLAKSTGVRLTDIVKYIFKYKF
jgi:hypothetical protein